MSRTRITRLIVLVLVQIHEKNLKIIICTGLGADCRNRSEQVGVRFGGDLLRMFAELILAPYFSRHRDIRGWNFRQKLQWNLRWWEKTGGDKYDKIEFYHVSCWPNINILYITRKRILNIFHINFWNKGSVLLWVLNFKISAFSYSYWL